MEFQKVLLKIALDQSLTSPTTVSGDSPPQLRWAERGEMKAGCSASARAVVSSIRLCARMFPTGGWPKHNIATHKINQQVCNGLLCRNRHK